MKSNQRNLRSTVWLGSLALALLLLGGTAALADGQQCYSCGSRCTEQGVVNGIWYKIPGSDPAQWVRYGGVGKDGWAQCSPGSQCFQNVQAACKQQCDACLFAGGHYGGETHEESYRSCGDAQCSIDTGWTTNPDIEPPQRTSVCLDFCLCAAAKFCRDTQIVGGGIFSTNNSKCACPN